MLLIMLAVIRFGRSRSHGDSLNAQAPLAKNRHPLENVSDSLINNQYLFKLLLYPSPCSGFRSPKARFTLGRKLSVYLG
jgi:hypothetical protein